MIGEHLQVMCFASCYLAALVCEVLRLVERGALRRRVSLVLTATGLVLHTVYLVARAVTKTHGLPISTLFESLVVFAWLLAVTYLYLAWRYHRVAVGLFALPLVLASLAVACIFFEQGARTDEAVSKFWGVVHGIMLLVGAGAVTGAFVAGVMYIVQSRRLKAKHLPRPGLDLPSLERLETFNRRMVNLGFPLLTVGIAIGVLINLSPSAGPGRTLSWLDAKIVATVLCWAVFGFLLHARYNPSLRGRKVAYLTVVAFLFMLFSLFGVELLLGTTHVGLEVGP